MTLITIRCLGTFEVIVDAQVAAAFPTDKVRALLAYLALESRTELGIPGSRPHRREALASLFWPEMPSSFALSNLRLALHRLRQALDRAAPRTSDALLTITRQTVQLNQGAVPVDAIMFQELLAATIPHTHADLSRCEECLGRLSQAASLYHGELLAGFALDGAPAFEEWLLLRREMLHQQALLALQTLTWAYEQRGDNHQAHVYARRQLAFDPLREESYRQLMRILARLGLSGEALAQYEACRHMLSQELGLEPDGATVALYEKIRAGEIGRQPNQETSGRADETNGRVALDLPASSGRQEWSEAPEIPHVYGRDRELAQLKRWLVQDRCRLATVLGMGGVGKTTLAAAVAKAVARSFDMVIWRSLLNAPPLDELLRGVLQALSRQRLTDVPAHLDTQLALLLDHLRQQRCLLVLDNFESILQPDEPGQARPGYDGYTQLIRFIAERQHQSCLLLTSRERLQGMAHREQDLPLVCSLALGGLDVAAGQAMLTARGLSSTHMATSELVERYSGNPLALKLVAQTVQELFGSDIASFLATEAPIFDDIRSVLDQQFARLSRLEQELLIWLAIEREPISVQALRENLVSPASPRAVIEALRGLRLRSLVEQNARGCALQNVVTEYLTDVLVGQIRREIEGDTETRRRADKDHESADFLSPPLPVSLSALNRYALIKATAKEYVRASQERLILQPLAQGLVARLGSARLVEKLKLIIASLREGAEARPGYAAGNILNLLLHLGVDVRGYDFSRLHVWQAYLQGAHLPSVNFRGANLAHSVFTYAFGDILAVHFDESGQLQVAGLAQGRICLWRAIDGQLLREYQAFGAGASIASFSPDGRILASADTDHQVRLWDVARGQLMHTLSGHTETPWTVTLSPRGHVIASSGRDGAVHLWDVQTGRLRRILQGHTTGVHALAFSADGQTLASGDVDGMVRIWWVESASPLHAFQAHTDEVHALAFNAAGTILASGSYDRTIRLWHIPGEHGRVQALHTLRVHTQMIRRLVMSPDGHTLASGGHDPFACLWDTRSGQALHTLLGHAYPIHHLAFSTDGQTLATVGVDQTVCLWDVASGRRLDTLRAHSSHIYALDFSPDGQLLASGGADGIVRLWDMRAPGRIAQTCQGQMHSIYAVAFSPDGALLAAGGRDQTIGLWDIRSSRIVRTLDGHADDVEAIQFSVDGQRLASASSDCSVRVWDVQHGQTIHALREHTDRVRSCAFSPDQRLVASGSQDRTIRLWDVKTGQITQTFYGHTNGVKWVAFSGDGRLLASSSYDRTMRLWDVASGQSLYIWPAQNSTILSVAFHPDGELLATGATDYTVRLWHVQTGRLLAILRGHTDLVECVCFSPNGRWLASGSADETIRLWDVATGACLSILRADGPYACMDIAGVTGISVAQKMALKALGAVDE
jgi:WD40 repeat protein/DNA-binding SARP family transcriptional activator